MKVFVWDRIERATSSYHSEGGVVVFADTEAEARALASAAGAIISESEMPDDVRTVDGGDIKVFVMPDAGCC